MDTGNSIPNIQWAASQKLNMPADMEITASAPKLGFWNEAAPFASDDEVLGAPEVASRFTILHVEDRAECKILVGRDRRAIVANCGYRAGMRVRVYDGLSDATFVDGAGPDAPPTPADLKGAGQAGDGGTYIVDDVHNAILIEDDILPVTCFCTALECVNNPLLSRMVADISFEYSHPAAVLGRIIHEIIQVCIMEKSSNLQFIVATARRLLSAHERELYTSNTSDKALLNDLLKCVRHIVRFLEAKLDISTAEQGVLSRDLGLRGYIDCYGPGLIVEIKTGKAPQVSHRAQLLLYTLLILEGEDLLDAGGRHRRAASTSSTKMDGRHTLHTLSSVANGAGSTSTKCTKEPGYKPMIYYVKTGEFVTLNLKYSEIAPLLQLRNKVAATKQIVECSTPELRPSRVYRRIQDLGASHFLRMQLEGIEQECRAESKYLKAVVTRRDVAVAVLKFTEEVQASDYLSLYSRTHKRIADGVVDRAEGRIVHVKLREQLSSDRVVYACADWCDVFYRYMRWSLIYLAYPKYFQSCNPGALRGVRLPNEGSPVAPPARPDPPGADETASDSCSFDSNAVLDESDAGYASPSPGPNAVVGSSCDERGASSGAESSDSASSPGIFGSAGSSTGLSNMEFSDSSGDQPGDDAPLTGLSPNGEDSACADDSIDSIFSLPADG